MAQTLTCNSEFIFDRNCVPIDHVVQADNSNMMLISFFGFGLFCAYNCDFSFSVVRKSDRHHLICVLKAFCNINGVIHQPFKTVE